VKAEEQEEETEEKLEEVEVEEVEEVVEGKLGEVDVKVEEEEQDRGSLLSWDSLESLEEGDGCARPDSPFDLARFLNEGE
jgi:hypothetical protein